MPDLRQAIRDRLAELRANAPIDRDNIAYRDGLLNACEAVSALLDAPDEAEEAIDLAGGAWTIRRTGEHVTILDAAGKVRHMSNGQMMTAVHLAMQLAKGNDWPKRTGIYAASRVRHAGMWRQCRANGTPILSTWIDEAGPGETADLSDLWARVQREVTSAERLVLFIDEEDFPLKGALVEVGMALAAGVPVRVVMHPDIHLEETSLRPLGSWARHPLVAFDSILLDAFTTPLPAVFQDQWPESAKQLADARDEYRLLAGSLASATAKLADAIRERDESRDTLGAIKSHPDYWRTHNELTEQRDQACEAAQWLYERMELSGDIADAKQRYPWLAEKGAEHAQ